MDSGQGEHERLRRSGQGRRENRERRFGGTGERTGSHQGGSQSTFRQSQQQQQNQQNREQDYQVADQDIRDSSARQRSLSSVQQGHVRQNTSWPELPVNIQGNTSSGGLGFQQSSGTPSTQQGISAPMQQALKELANDDESAVHLDQVHDPVLDLPLPRLEGRFSKAAPSQRQPDTTT